MADSSQIILEKVRLSFPDIWKAKAVQEGSEPKYGAHFLLDKDTQDGQIARLKGAIWAAAKEKFADKAKELIQKNKLHVCLHEGSEKDYDGYDESNMFVSTSSPKRPLIVDRDKTPLIEDDRKPYAGCYVNAVIRLWPQDNQFGKRINAELLAIQFVTDGDAFGAAPVSPDVFEDLTEGEDKSGKKGKAKGKAKEPEEEPGNGGDEDDDDSVPF
jgi:hypothetical protein